MILPTPDTDSVCQFMALYEREEGCTIEEETARELLSTLMGITYLTDYAPIHTVR